MPKHSQMLLALTALVCATLSHAQITGYSNTLSTYAGSATGVVSTYSFVPPSGVANAIRGIRITNQGFSAASSPLKAACTNVVSMPSAAISTAASTDQTLQVTFKISTPFTAHASNNKITLTFAPGLVTAQAINLCSITSPASVVSTSAYASDAVTLTVTSALAAGSVTVTCSGLTLAAQAAVFATPTGTSTFGLKIETSTSATAALAAYLSSPAIGAVTASIDALQLTKSVGAGGVAAVTFKISTPFTAHASNNKITLTFPAGLVNAQAINLCSITSPASVVSTSAYAANSITLTVTSALAAGSVTVTCSGLTLAAQAAVTATASGTTGLKIETSKDTIAAYASTPCVGCVVADAATALSMSKAVATDGTATITFTTSTAIAPAHATNNKVILTFPAGHVTAGTGCAISSPATTGTATYATDAITIALGSTATLAAGAVTVTCTGLTLAAKAAVAATAGGTTGLKIETSKDTIAAYASTPCVGCVTVDSSTSPPAFTATWSSAKTLDITGAVDMWTASASTVVTCTVDSFTNAPFASARRSLLQTNQVEISTVNAAGTALTTSSTGQTFPASIAVAPTRTLYLPKASGAASGVAWVCVALSALLFWL